MRTIIKITKQEAIDAWKLMNNYQNDKEIIVEIEENNNFSVVNFPKYYTGTQYLVGNGGVHLPSCPLCGKYGQHVCVTC